MLINLDLNSLNEKEARKNSDFSKSTLLSATPENLVANYLISKKLLNIVTEKGTSEKTIKFWTTAHNTIASVVKERKSEIAPAIADVACRDKKTGDKLWEFKVEFGLTNS